MTRSVEIPGPGELAMVIWRATSGGVTMRDCRDAADAVLAEFAAQPAALPYLAPAGDGGLRAALERRLGTLPTMAFDNGYPVRAMPKADLLSLLALYPAPVAVPQPVDREPMERTVRRAWDNSKFPDEIINDIVNALLALLGGSVLAGEQEQVAPE